MQWIQWSRHFCLQGWIQEDDSWFIGRWMWPATVATICQTRIREKNGDRLSHIHIEVQLWNEKTKKHDNRHTNLCPVLDITTRRTPVGHPSAASRPAASSRLLPKKTAAVSPPRSSRVGLCFCAFYLLCAFYRLVELLLDADLGLTLPLQNAREVEADPRPEQRICSRTAVLYLCASIRRWPTP